MQLKRAGQKRTMYNIKTTSTSLVQRKIIKYYKLRLHNNRLKLNKWLLLRATEWKPRQIRAQYEYMRGTSTCSVRVHAWYKYVRDTSICIVRVRAQYEYKLNTNTYYIAFNFMLNRCATKPNFATFCSCRKHTCTVYSSSCREHIHSLLQFLQKAHTWLT